MGLTRRLLIVLVCLFVAGGFGDASGAESDVRKAVFAGSFYPSDPAALSRTVDSLLKEEGTQTFRPKDPIVGIMAPHAGYQYSGRTAAHAYSTIKGGPYSTVIILGGSHRVPFKGIAVYPGGSWESPLGRVPVNEAVAGSILKSCAAFARVYPQAFQMEHSLEVQLPFLQKTLKGFSIVPIVMGRMDTKEYEELAVALTAVLNREAGKALIIASSDMSHFHSYDTASRRDKQTLEQIGKLDAARVLAGVEKEEYELCGYQAVVTLMIVAKGRGGEATVLSYTNSGDSTSDRTRVVGYGAVVFTGPPRDEEALSPADQARLLALARKTLDETVTKGSPPRAAAADGRLAEKKGVFVTLKKNGNLRGCIGYVEPRSPLYAAVSEMTVAAATSDPRFRPVTKQELKDIHIEISVLSPFRRITNEKEIEVGRHGLYLVKGPRAGLLLPQVPVEQGWARDEFLRQICLKAGLPPQAWREKDARLSVFSAQIFSE
jgi:AmmeMemoRadiSam system protein B/AmmeMemoRadiSam system protein A